MAESVANPSVNTENKSAKRKKSKPVEGAVSSENRSPLSEVPGAHNGANGAEAGNGEAGESAYVKELTKTIRNLRKRLANTAKVDQIVAANPGKSLVQLLDDKKINADQKQQAENKPGLESQVKITEERLSHYKQFEEETNKKHTDEKEATTKLHQKELERIREESYQKGKDEAKKEFRNELLTLSRFLRAAAASRQSEVKQPESEAFEGALLLVYGGDMAAVSSMESLMSADEAIVSKTDGEPSGFSFKQVRDKSLEQATVAGVTEDTTSEAEADTSAAAVESDPTVLHASLTEIDQANAQENGPASQIEAAGLSADTGAIPEAATIDAGAANAVAATASFDPASDPMTSSISNDWTEVPRDPAETDNGLDATPAAPSNNAWTETAPAAAGSWAEDVPAEAAPANDGFSEVQGRHRGRGRGGRGGGGGEYRGRGGFRGRGRGRGGDGEGRGRGGRGRGGYRGGRGGAEGGQS